MRAMKLIVLMVLMTGAISVVAPAQADALFRVGGEMRWVPVAAESMEEDGERLDADRQLESVGIGARALFDFSKIGIGAKFGFTQHVFADDDLTYSQFDANVHLRSNVPWTRLNFILEAGPTIALDIGDVGYNVVLGTEVDILGWPHIDMNLGLAAQYARVPIGIGPDEIRLDEGVRGMVTLGVDFSLID